MTLAEALDHAIAHHLQPEVLTPLVPPDGAEDPAVCSCRLHFIVPVWGAVYVKRFLDWGLPSHLAPGNLPAVAGLTHRYDIVTDAEGAALVRASAGYARLTEFCDVRLLTPDEYDHRHGIPDDVLGYTKMTRFYNAAVADAAGPGVAHVFLTAEGIFSDGMFTGVARRFAQGYRAVVLPGFRACEEDVIDDLLDMHLTSDGLILDADPRALVGWVLRHPHPMTTAHVWGDEGPRLHPHYYFPVGDAGFVAHCFHMHPLAVWPEPDDPAEALVPPGQTLDHEYLQNTVSLNKTYLVTDSDEMVVIDIAHRDHLRDTISPGGYGLHDVAEFAAAWTNGYHRRLFERGIKVHADDLDDAWPAVELRARAVTADVISRLERTVEMPVYARARAHAAERAAVAQRPWWVRLPLRLERAQNHLRHRVETVGWLRAFAVRSRWRAWRGRRREARHLARSKP